MKRILTIIIAFIGMVCFEARSQETAETLAKGICLFEDFTDGQILLKNRLYVRTRFNYDCVKQELHFIERDVDMIMDNTSNVDTLYIAGRKFIPCQTRFLEYIPTTYGAVRVDWKARAHNIGRKGAMGITTQAGGIDKIDVKMMQHKGYDRTGNEVYRVQYENTYIIMLDGKEKRFTNLKSLLKLFPKEMHESINQFAGKQHTNFGNPIEVVDLLGLIFDAYPEQ